MAEAGPGGVMGAPMSPRHVRQRSSPSSPNHGPGPGSPLYASVHRSPEKQRCLSPDLSSLSHSGTGSHGVSDTPASTLSSSSSISSTSSRMRDELDENVNWKERCYTLEASLLRFKQRASQIREMLASRVSATFPHIEYINTCIIT